MRPGQHRIPSLRLPLDQAGRRRGAIAQQIRTEILRHLAGHRLRRIRHRVDHRIGEPGERHARRIDQLGLRVPLSRDRLCKRCRRCCECAPRRRLYRLTIKQQREAARLGFAHMRLAVESLAQFRPRATARRLARVEGLVFENLSENIAHQDHVIVRRNKGGRAADPGPPILRKIAGSTTENIKVTRRFSRYAAMLSPLSGSEKASENLQLIGHRQDGRIGSLGGFYPIYSAP